MKRETFPYGYYVLGKVWTSEYVSDFSKVTQQKIELAKKEDSKNYNFLYPLKSNDKINVGYLGVKLSSNVVDLISENFKHQLIFFLISGFMTILILSICLYYTIVKPLRTISYIISTKDTTKFDTCIARGDELGDISKEIALYFNQTAILEQYKEAIDFGHIVSKTDMNGVITYVNKEFETRSGYSSDELIGRKHSIVKHPDNSKEFFEHIWKIILSGQTYEGIIKNRNRSGNPYYTRGIIAPIYDVNKNVIEYISIRTDVTELFEQIEYIKKLSTTDSLTQLPNKKQLRLDIFSTNIKKTLVFLNISGFRGINDSFGYEAGDELLIEFSKKLYDLVNQRAHVYRFSGDEFAILFDNLNRDNEVLIQHIVDDLESGVYLIGESQISLRLICAISSGTDDIREKCAITMDYAKNHNISFAVFEKNHQIQSEINNSLEMTSLIQNAIEHDLVKPFGQKIVDTSNNQVYKVESLMRIVEKNGTIVSPYQFLQYAKKSRLYTKLTQIMMQKTLEHFHKSNIEVSLNFTFEDILDDKTTNMLFMLIEKYNMHNRVIIELVESEELSSIKEIDNFIKKAKSYGCKISIDDFGSGYSNFVYLLNIGADYIKIDGGLIKNIDTDKNSYLIVKMIVSLAKKMGFKIVAEFVHSQKIKEIVESLEIEFLQGYYLHQPEPIEKIT